ncbi:MAG TPA: DUF3800 domain-containing protein [Pyrinomonadaceae bacterium]|nr:DUF3800 domain-containing protein [Pyrinomonadaceae bacterium]
MLFIDESGDPGLKIGLGSSKYFIVALVAFDDRDEAQAADDRIALLRKEQGLSENFEFHFSNMRPAHRRLFLSAIASYDFFYFGIVINKAKLTGPGFQFKDSFYKYACGLIFENAKPLLSNATVIVDGSGSRDFRRQLKNYLLRRLKDDYGKCLIKKVKTEDSDRNNLLQLADMVVGSIARFYSGKKDSRDCRDISKHREIYVQFWPK